ncbi:MAG: type II toxin-antitoxin system VapC family toxin [Candidatus Poribacteria bacterium]|nr:type II toxin-antitoxin system VapC family toxin [Candidatus Poribacteria bacterium]
MDKIYTVDASVFLNAFNPYEVGHEVSHKLLAELQSRSIPIVVPTLLLPETAAAIGRGRQDTQLAQQFVSALSRLPHLIFIPMDIKLAQQAADIAAQYRLRGSDAVYATVAQRFGSTLITLDRQQRERVAPVISTRYPAEVQIDA